MFNLFRLKALTDFFWVTETSVMATREFVNLKSLLKITTLIPNQLLWPVTFAKSPEEEVSTLRDTLNN